MLVLQNHNHLFLGAHYTQLMISRNTLIRKTVVSPQTAIQYRELDRVLKEKMSNFC